MTKYTKTFADAMKEVRKPKVLHNKLNRHTELQTILDIKVVTIQVLLRQLKNLQKVYQNIQMLQKF